MAELTIGKVRYVPKGDWSSTETYTVLDTVNYSNMTYSAIKDVPTGVSPLNTSYWMPLYGNGSSTDLKWKDKKWTVVGDSLTGYNTRTSKHYFDYVADTTGIEIYNMGVNGTGYAQTFNGLPNFYTRITGVPVDSDCITILGSINDNTSGITIGSPSDTGFNSLCGYINETIDRLYTVMPTAHLGIISTIPVYGYYEPWGEDQWVEQYTEAQKEICQARSIPFLDLLHCSNLRPWDEEFRKICYTHDETYLHPDETGHSLFAPQVGNFLENLLN